MDTKLTFTTELVGYINPQLEWPMISDLILMWKKETAKTLYDWERERKGKREVLEDKLKMTAQFWKKQT